MKRLALFICLIFGLLQQAQAEPYDFSISYNQQQLCALKAKADQGDAKADLEIGKFLYRPAPYSYWNTEAAYLVRTNVDMSIAAQYYEKAAQLNNKEAIINLAILYYDLLWTKAKYNGSDHIFHMDKKLWDKAIHWAQKIPSDRQDEANYLLALLYNVDDPSLQNVEKSNLYLAKAMDNEFSPAWIEKSLRLVNNPNGSLEDKKDGAETLASAAEMEDPQAIHFFGQLSIVWNDKPDIWELGLNVKEGLSMLRKNAANGYIPSIFWLAEHDPDEPEKWLREKQKIESQKASWFSFPTTKGVNSQNRHDLERLHLFQACP